MLMMMMMMMMIRLIIVEDEVLETKKQVVRYIPKVVPEVENLVLVPTQPKKINKIAHFNIRTCT